MMKKHILYAVMILSGCVSVYGPTKSDNSPQASEGETAAPGQPEAATLIGNRRPDELFSKVEAWFKAKGLTPAVANAPSGVVAAIGDNSALADTYLDCSALQQVQPLQRHYRLVAQVYSAGEGSRVSVQVNGIAQLTTADGNDKVKPTECRSNGVFEKDLLEALRK